MVPSKYMIHKHTFKHTVCLMCMSVCKYFDSLWRMWSYHFIDIYEPNLVDFVEQKHVNCVLNR